MCVCVCVCVTVFVFVCVCECARARPLGPRLDRKEAFAVPHDLRERLRSEMRVEGSRLRVKGVGSDGASSTGARGVARQSCAPSPVSVALSLSRTHSLTHTHTHTHTQTPTQTHTHTHVTLEGRRVHLKECNC